MKQAKISEYSVKKSDNSAAFERNNIDNFEAYAVSKGMLEITTKDEVIKLYPGDMMIFPPHSFFSAKTVSENGADFTAIRFDFCDKKPAKNIPRVYRLNHDNSSLYDILSNEIAENEGSVTQAANSIFNALILRCLNEKDNSPSLSNSHLNIYKDAVSFMNKNMNIMLSVPEIAHNCGICETTLKSAFKQHTGKSVKAYYNEMKLQNAAQLLKKGINAKEVSVTLGFSTLSYFSQFFKRESGCSIRDFLKSNRK